MDAAAGSVGKVGVEAKQADKSTGQLGQTMGKQVSPMRKAAGTLAKWAGGAAAVYAAKRGIQASVSATMDLAKGTLAIQRATNLDTRTASQWVAVTKARGIQTTQFQRGLTTLSKQLEGARAGSKTATAAFQQLGVSQEVIASGDVNQAILQSADALSKMTNPAQKAALAQKLFGRSGLALLPMLNQGSKGIQEQMDLAAKYGDVLSNTQGAKEMIARQRELKYATDGLKVSVGTALLPAIVAVMGVITQLTATFQPLLRSGTAVKIMLGALVAAFLSFKAMVIAATVAENAYIIKLVAVKVATAAAAVGQWLLNAAMLAFPVVAIVAAIAAVVAGFYLLYTRVGWFRKAVQNTWAWIKANWPLLLGILTGPFGTAVILIARNWDKIKAGARGLVSWFRNLGRDIVKAIAAGIKAAPELVLNAIKGLLPGGLAKKVGGSLGLWQHGGVVPGRQWGIVGERGPELLQLPGGTRITPLPAPSVSAAPALAGVAGVGSQTTAHFYLDRRLLGTAVAQDTADQKARR